MYGLLRPLLFRMDAEKAHQLTLRGLSVLQSLKCLPLVSKPTVYDPVRIGEMTMRNRVGLAAGLDKNGTHTMALAALGFGFIEVGTVTPKPQAGNTRPRLFRLAEHHAIINRMGFNNDGVNTVVERLEKMQLPCPLGINIGKNKSTPNERAVDDYLIGLRRAYARADYITINISSPNTENLRELQRDDALEGLLSELGNARTQLEGQHGKRVPLWLKVAPDLEEAQITSICRALESSPVDALIVSNTTVSRVGVATHELAKETGGLSGKPLQKAADLALKGFRRCLPKHITLVGVGGIDNAESAVQKVKLGADLVQVYSGLIFQGPKLIHQCAKALQQHCG